MPMTVVTVVNAPASLRGDLTKWMQEIATGVYVGNFNRKVREALWKRIVDSIGEGEATMTYATRNELGYDFETLNSQRQVVDFDGIPLVCFIEPIKGSKGEKVSQGYSKAAKFHQARVFTAAKGKSDGSTKGYVVVDIETTGLDPIKNDIIEIAAYKLEAGKEEEYASLIKIEGEIPKGIQELTGITRQRLDDKGLGLQDALEGFLAFVGDKAIVGYNVDFDIKFINKALDKFSLPPIRNKVYDLMRFVKKENKFMDNYRLETALKEYGIEEKQPHRALEDARLIYKLSRKVDNFQEKIK